MSAEKMPPSPFTADEAGLHGLLLEQAGTIGEMARESDEYAMKALRYDEGTAALQWQLQKVARHGSASVRAEVMLRCMGELVAFGETGREPGWLRLARADMDR